MARIQPVDMASAHSNVKATLGQIQGALGNVPAMFRTLGQSPAALAAMWGFFGAMGQSSLPAKLREQIALAVGETNGCSYCVNAHAAIGKHAGLTDGDVNAARRWQAGTSRDAAALAFASSLLEKKGHVSDADMAAVKAAGFDDAQVLELVAVVVQNVFTNWVNHVAGTESDFPAAPSLR
jgi:uncharacterized peroxidase-related enzyme